MRFPPGLFGSAIVQSAMVQVAEGHDPFVADLTSKRPRLGKAEMMRLAWCPSADEAGEGGHVFEVLAVPNSLRCGDCEHALVHCHCHSVGGLGAVLSRKLRKLGFKHMAEHACKVHAFAVTRTGRWASSDWTRGAFWFQRALK